MTGVEETIKAVQSLSLKDEYVYLIHEEPSDASGKVNYKVGRSGDPDKRMGDLQTGNIRKFTLVWTFADKTGKGEGEGNAKTALKEYKRNLGGGTEWFTANEEKQCDDLIQKFKDAAFKK